VQLHLLSTLQFGLPFVVELLQLLLLFWPFLQRPAIVSAAWPST